MITINAYANIPVAITHVAIIANVTLPYSTKLSHLISYPHYLKM